MSELEKYKQKAIESITDIINEVEESLNTLIKMREAVKAEDLVKLLDQSRDLTDHVSTAFGEHLRFDVPDIYDFTEELQSVR